MSVQPIPSGSQTRPAQVHFKLGSNKSLTGCRVKFEVLDKAKPSFLQSMELAVPYRAFLHLTSSGLDLQPEILSWAANQEIIRGLVALKGAKATSSGSITFTEVTKTTTRTAPPTRINFELLLTEEGRVGRAYIGPMVPDNLLAEIVLSDADLAVAQRAAA
ncbi:MAG: hypothetical protein WC890_06600 [Candidatus Margulisiibacteriota bacterium]